MVDYIPDGKSHEISCRIKGYTPNKEDGSDPGERLEMMNFYRGTIKLSIGAEGDSSYPKEFEEYDYDIDLLSNGVSYVTEAQTRTTRFLFGVAWLLNTVIRIFRYMS